MSRDVSPFGVSRGNTPSVSKRHVSRSKSETPSPLDHGYQTLEHSYDGDSSLGSDTCHVATRVTSLGHVSSACHLLSLNDGLLTRILANIRGSRDLARLGAMCSWSTLLARKLSYSPRCATWPSSSRTACSTSLTPRMLGYADSVTGLPYKKPCKLVASMDAALEVFAGCKCDRSHSRELMEGPSGLGQRTLQTPVWPEELDRLVIHSVIKQAEFDNDNADYDAFPAEKRKYPENDDMGKHEAERIRQQDEQPPEP